MAEEGVAQVLVDEQQQRSLVSTAQCNLGQRNALHQPAGCIRILHVTRADSLCSSSEEGVKLLLIARMPSCSLKRGGLTALASDAGYVAEL